MSRRIVLHVGLMKSGTSFLQSVMKSNAGELRRRGVLFPGGGSWRPQVRAVRDVAERGGGGQPPRSPNGPWARMMREVDEFTGTSVISMEFLGPRPPKKIQEIVTSLPPAEVEVVVTVRDLARTVPAMWQESVQNWSHVTWPDYLAGVRAEDMSSQNPGRAFWTRQGAARIVRNWTAAVGREHLTVVTVPPPGAAPSLLWERFASVVPVDPSGIDLEVRANPSLGLASVLVMRAMNERLRAQDEPITPGEYQRTVKQLLAKRGLSVRSREEPRLGMDEDWVVERGAQEVEALRALDPRVVGDLAELACRPVPGTSPEQVSTEEQLAAALDALAYVTGQLAARRGPAQGGKASRSKRGGTTPGQGTGKGTGQGTGKGTGKATGRGTGQGTGSRGRRRRD